MKYVFLNWKAATDYSQALALANFLKRESIPGNRQVVVLPPVIFLLPVVKILKGSSISVGLQDTSPFAWGPYTGEVPLSMAAPYVSYCLLGHSERRKISNESNEMVNRKIVVCHKYDVTPVVCVSQENQLQAIEVPDGLKDVFIAYESPAYIGGETILDLSEVLKFHQSVKNLPALSTAKFIYGGSVGEQNISMILGQAQVDGVVIGHASLDPERIKKMLLS